VLRPDVGVPQRPRLVLREDDHLAGALGEALEHERTLRQVTDCYLAYFQPVGAVRSDLERHEVGGAGLRPAGAGRPVAATPL
jgi:hypothetical protein